MDIDPDPITVRLSLRTEEFVSALERLRAAFVRMAPALIRWSLLMRRKPQRAAYPKHRPHRRKR